jgi:hypothetical protein
VKWLELVSIIEALVIRIGGLILITLFIAQAIAKAWFELRNLLGPGKK